MPLYAQFDPASSRVTGWYDTATAVYATLPAAAVLLEVSAAQWAARLADPSGWAVVAGALVAWVPPPPTLAAVQAAQIALLRAACDAAITGGYTSSALGAPHTYPSTVLDQQNMIASVTASLLPGLAAGWTTPFWCEDSTGAWAMAPHTAAQIQQAGSDGKAAVVAAQQHLATLSAEVAAAATTAAVQAIAW